MTTVVLVLHLMLAIGLVGVILIQRSEGGGLGIGGGGGFMTTRGTANLLTRTTGVIAALFIVTSLFLAVSATRGKPQQRSILDAPSSSAPASNAPASAPAVPATPSPSETPAAPAVPLAR
jgi:preprotein translocase subunit SecG